MKDWHSVKLTPLSLKDRSQYAAMIFNVARRRSDPVAALYAKYKALPADVAANLVHIDMQQPGWANPPQQLVNQIAAELLYVRHFFCFAADPKQPNIDADEYVDETNFEEVYDALLALTVKDDERKLAEAAAAFCKGTQGACCG